MASVLRWLARPLALMAVGLAIAVSDLYGTSRDALPDVVGWLLVAVGAGLLAPSGSTGARHARTVQVLAGLAALLGVVELVSGGGLKPLHYAIVDDAHREGVGRVLLDLVVLLAEVGVVLAACVLAGGLAAAGGDDRWVRRWAWLRLGYLAAATAVVVLTPVFMLVDGDRVGDLGRSLLVGSVVPAVISFLWLGMTVVVTLALVSAKPWARSGGVPAT